MADEHDLGEPTSHSERLKIEYDRVMIELYRDMTRFCTPGIHSGVSELAILLDRNDKSMRNQFGPTSYDHAPTVHAFLQVIETLRSLGAVQEIARLADCVVYPKSPRATEVGAPADDAEAFQRLAKLAADVGRKHTAAAASAARRDELNRRDRVQIRESLQSLIAYTAHLITRLD